MAAAEEVLVFMVVVPVPVVVRLVVEALGCHQIINQFKFIRANE
jgi:hypothetical protein